MPTPTELLAELFEEPKLTRAVLSKPRSRELPAKVTVDPVELRGETAFRFTTQLADRTTHENLDPAEARERLGVLLADYGQGLLQAPEADWQVLGEKVLRRPPTRSVATREHDRAKRYLLEEGTPVPFLVELGVMTPDGIVRKSRYGKFRQVNRFLELVDDVVPSLRRDGPLRVVDFGCGKSYLTFAIHHLLTSIRGREVELVGLDLKEDVIASCQAFAERSGATGLRFERGDIAGFDAGGHVDLVVSLHACDTATDEALAQAVRWGADAILAVPCCQKEAYGQLESSLLALAAEQPERLVVDLAEVVFVDSTALGVLIEARTKLENRQSFLLAAPGLETHRALTISGLDQHLGVHESVDSALAAPIER